MGAIRRHNPPEVEKIISEQFLAADLDEMEKIDEASKELDYKYDIVWHKVAQFIVMHLVAVVGLYQMIFDAKWQTILFSIFLYFFGSMGTTAGAHRLWSHRSYKAKTPLRILLMIMNSIAHQNDVIEWARDHRCHHKWTDTDADPHNAKRGFFFSHIGWLMVRKHPQIRIQGAKLDLSDLYADPVIVFQKRYYPLLVIIFSVLLPIAIPVKLWNENIYVAFFVAVGFRYCAWLNATFLINSAAHAYGYKPYDAKITPAENIWTTISAVGEGGHNFHHTFPQLNPLNRLEELSSDRGHDYRTSEYSFKLNWTRVFIDFFALTGQVYDRKWVPDEIIKRQVKEQGDGTKRSKNLVF